MNKKLMKASIAGAAALALAAGGSTFAAWSDWDQITGNVTEAGHLQLDLNSTGTISNVGTNAIAPGHNRTIDFMVASADLDGVPNANLTMQMLNLASQENGCGGGNAEKAVDNCDVNDSGEFSEQGYIRVRYSNPVPVDDITFANNQCTGAGDLSNSLLYSPANDNNATHYPRLVNFAGHGAHSLGTLGDGQGICVRVDLGLDMDATNAVQTDSSTFDLKFNLAQ